MPLFYRRHLPHWQPDGAVIFVTFRLYHSLPKSALEKIAGMRKSLEIEKEKGKTPMAEIMRRAQRLFDLLEASLDDELKDSNSTSPRWLESFEVAGIVRSAMRFFEGKPFREHRYVIMPNHVHWLIEPLHRREKGFWPINEILKSVKGFSARKANCILERQGHFWQDESYDHWIRDRGDYHSTVAYIDENPVKAGLCARPEDWKWSSAYEQ